MAELLHRLTDHGLACNNMRPAIEFSAKHNIKPHLTTYKLEELPEMIELMVSSWLNATAGLGLTALEFPQSSGENGSGV